MRDHPGDVTRFLRASILAASALALVACGQTGTQRGQTIAPTTTEPARAAPGEVDPNAPVTVALLVPTGDPDQGAREAARGIADAARLASDDLRDPYLDLKVYDTAGPGGVAAATDRALSEGAKLILGPLRGEEALAAGPIAAREGVNVISFSTTAEAAGDNVWLIGMLPDAEADRIVGYAASQGYDAIGVFYAETPYGYAAYDAVADAVGRHGAYLAAASSYPRSFEGIQEASEIYAAEHKAGGAEAVVLPADGQELQAAASFLNYHDLLSSREKYLGLGKWNSAATRQEPTLVGGWFAAPDPARLEQFAARFSSAYGRRPGELDALGYDAVAVAGALLEDARARNATDAFSAASITDPSGFAGVNGVLRFTADGLNRRGLAVLEVQPDAFVVIDPAPRSLDAVF